MCNEPLTVIVLFGPSGSGKDEAARGLAARRGCMRVALGDGPKEAFDRLSGPTRQFHKDLDAAGVDIRRAWQLLGTECRKDVRNARLWASEAAALIRYASHYHPRPVRRFVVPDGRHLIEQAVLAAGAVAMGGRFAAVRVDRPGLETISEHSSEHEFKQIEPHSVILNNGDVEKLHALALSAFDAAEAGRIGIGPNSGPAALNAMKAAAVSNQEEWGF